MRILWIEDDAQVVAPAATFLAKQGCQVTHAPDGYAGLALACKENFDVIVLDMKMPGLSGLGVLQALRAEEVRTPVMVFTGHSEFEFRSGQLGATVYHEKPLAGADLEAAIRQAASLTSAPSNAIANSRALPTKASATLDPTGGADGVGLRHVRNAIGAMGLRYMELDLGVSTIANAEGISTGHLSDLFHHHVGHKVLEHLHDIRISEAKRLLSATNLSVYEVARNCGYHTTAELNLHFSRRTGCSPIEFRRREREKIA